MFFRDFVKSLYVPGTASEDIIYTIKMYFGDSILWKGKAKDIKNWMGINQNWIVVEMLIDSNDNSKAEEGVPRYNWNKIIIVI